MAESKAVQPRATGREVASTDNKGGYPAGDKTTTQMTPPPAAWVKPVAGAKPVPGGARSAETET